MVAHTTQDRAVPSALEFNEVFEITEQFAARLETPPCDQRPATADRNPTPAAAPVSPLPSDASHAAAGSIMGKFSDIGEKYLVDPRVLATGHCGSVRRCFDRATGQRYAVKSICKSHPAVELDALAREVTLLEEMKHRSIIRLVDTFEDADLVHLVTDLCDGGELFDRILERSSEDNGAACFTEYEAARIIHQILLSISYMHKLGIVHRDIKPENVLFETTENDSPIKIIDFGLSRKHLEGLEPPMTTIVGTPYYIAPEVLREKYDQSCDLWSVGVIAYVLLCGYPPFNGHNKHEIHRAVLRGHYCFRTEHWEGVSFEAQDFVRLLLQADPRRRMTAEQALNHPWMSRHSDRLIEVERRDDLPVERTLVIVNDIFNRLGRMARCLGRRRPRHVLASVGIAAARGADLDLRRGRTANRSELSSDSLQL